MTEVAEVIYAKIIAHGSRLKPEGSRPKPEGSRREGKMKFLIHAVEERQDNVKEIVTELERQGADLADIIVLYDFGHKGNLAAAIERYDWLTKNTYSYVDVWHLQDDIELSEHFMDIVRKLNDRAGIICGFCSEYCVDQDAKLLPPGPTESDKMWLSFPCIRIPVHITTAFSEWVKAHKDDGGITGKQIRSGKRDDELFRTFLKEEYTGMVVYNITPNLVDHRDDLCGGSIVSPQRLHCPRATYYEG